MHRKAIDALKLDTRMPRAITDILELREAAVERIRAQQYKPAKEADEIRKADAAAAEQIAAFRTRTLAEMDGAAAKDLQALDLEEAQRRALPLRDLGETDAAYSTRLIRRLIEEQQRVQSALSTAADLQVIATVSNPATVAALVDGAIARHSQTDPESVARIGMLAEARLGDLAQREAMHSDNGPAMQAHAAVSIKLRDWRNAQQANSIDARRDAIRARQSVRSMELENAISTAAAIYQQGGRPAGSDSGIPAADAYRFAGLLTT